MQSLLAATCLMWSAASGAPSLSDIVALGDAAPVPVVAAPQKAETPAPLTAPRLKKAAPPAERAPFPTIAASDVGPETMQGSLKTWLLLGVFAAVGLVLLKTRRKGIGTRTISVIERVGLAKGRELLLVQVADQVMMLSSSDKGVHILRDHVDIKAAAEAAPAVPKSWVQHLSTALHGRVPSLDEALEPMLPSPAPSSKAIESTEDAEIRRKLMAALSAEGPTRRTA